MGPTLFTGASGQVDKAAKEQLKKMGRFDVLLILS